MKKYLTVVALSVGILLLGWSGYAQRPPAKKAAPAEKQAAPGPRGPLAALKDALNLTPEQEAKIKDMQKARQEEQKAFQGEMRKLRSELNPLLNDPKADPAKINGLIDQLSKLNADRMKKAIANRNPLAKILTQEQLDKLKAARGRLMGMGGMMRGRGFGQGMGPMGRGGLMGQRFMGRGSFGRFGMMGPRGWRGWGMMQRRGMRGGWWW